MLDKRTAALLQTINLSCGEGRYRIFTEEDFLSQMPNFSDKGAGKEQSEIAARVAYLSENGYIEVKYAANGMFCVRPLPLGKSYCEREKERLAEGKIWLKYFMSTAFFGGLIGGLSGALIVLVTLLLLH